MKNTNNNTTEKIADFEKNAMHNEASETSTVQAVAAKPSFWERCKQWMNEEVDRVKRDHQRFMTLTAPIRRFARWISSTVSYVINLCVKLSIILIALMMLNSFFTANPDAAASVSNFFDAIWDGICSVPQYFVDVLKSVFAPFINLFS